MIRGPTKQIKITRAWFRVLINIDLNLFLQPVLGFGRSLSSRGLGKEPHAMLGICAM